MKRPCRAIALAVAALAFALPGPASLARSGTGQPITDADWRGFHFDDQNNRVNPFETVLNTSNVSSLVSAWTFTGTSFFMGSPAVVDGVLYEGSQGNEGGSLYAMDAVTGTVHWIVPVDMRGSPSVENGVVYVVSSGFYAPPALLAVDATDGSMVWQVDVDWFGRNTSPTVANGLVYVGSSANAIAAFDAATGSLRWSTTLGGGVTAPPAVVDGVLYTGTPLGRIVALDALTGTLLWRTRVHEGFWRSGPTVADGTMYIGARDGRIYAINAATGAHLWTFKTAGADETSPVVSAGIVYVQTENQTYALEGTTGAPIWRVAVGAPGASPALANGVLYVADYLGQIYALDAATGKKLWTGNLGSWVECSPVVVNGMIFIGTNRYEIHAFTLP